MPTNNLMLENDLIDFYDANEVLNFDSVYATEALKKYGDDTRGILFPLFSSWQNADVCITLNMDGTLHSVSRAVTKIGNKTRQKVIILPATEDSASRGRGVKAFPLFDKMPYICNDSTMPGYDANKYNVYITALAKFADYADEHNYPYIRTIYNYIIGGTIYKDIPAEMHVIAKKSDEKDKKTKKTDEVDEIDEVNEADKSDEHDKQIVISFIYFNVFDDCKTYELYKDKQLYDLWGDYYNNIIYADKPMIMDAFTGTLQRPVANASCKLIFGSSKSKLFSCNNYSQYSRFYFSSKKDDESNVMPIGMLSEQKIAQALRYINNIQSFSFGSKIGKSDNFNDKIQTMIFGIPAQTSTVIVDNNIRALFNAASTPSDIDACINDYDKFKKMVLGYNTKTKFSDTAHILRIASTGTGRLAVDAYDLCTRNDLISNLYVWQAEGKVPIKYWYKDKTYGTYHASPNIMDLAKSCYLKTDACVRIAHQLINAMLFHKRISLAIVNRSIAETAKMQAKNNDKYRRIESDDDWDNWVFDSLYRTCALILHYYNYNKNEGEYVTMSLKTENVSADYAIGRIVSLANDAETAYHKVRDEKNFTTKAVSLATKIQRNPLAGITTLMGQLSKYEKIVAHWNKTHTKQYCYFGISWNEIKNLLADYGDSITNHAVGLDYFIGLAAQEQAIQKRIEDYTARKAEKDNAEKNTEEV